MHVHLGRILIATLLLPACAELADSQGSREDSVEQPIVTLLHVNDTHSHLLPWGPKDTNLDGTLGGIARAASIVATEKMTGENVLFVHAGDLVHGDLFFNEYLGVPELALLQTIGLDVLAIGNHEFQFGPQFLAAVLAAVWPAGGGVSVVGTNLDLSGYPVLGFWIEQHVMKEVGGVKVGFFALTTPFDPLEQPSPVVIDPDLAGVSQLAVTALRNQGADVVVGVAHVGLAQSRLLAENVTGIDVIVNGHDHAALAAPEQIGTTLIVSAGEYYRHVGKLKIAIAADHVELVDYDLISVDASISPLLPVQAVVDSLVPGITTRYGDVYHEAIGWADKPILDEPWPRHGKLDTAIGNLFTDAYRARAGTQIAIEANGFLDEGLPAGPIVRADVYRSMSYGLPVLDADLGRYIVAPFRLATFRLTGAELLAGLEAALAGPPDVFPQVSGMRFKLDSRRPPGQRVLADSVRIGDQRLDLAASYSIAATEGLVMFLPMLGVTPSDVEVLTDVASEAAQAWISASGTLESGTDGRIRDVGTMKPGH